jgi:hypothetical protein
MAWHIRQRFWLHLSLNNPLFLKNTWDVALYFIFLISVHTSLYLSGWFPVWRHGACASRKRQTEIEKSWITRATTDMLKWVEFYDSCVIKHSVIFKKLRIFYAFCAWPSNAIALTWYWCWYQDNSHIPSYWPVDWLINWIVCVVLKVITK